MQMGSCFLLCPEGALLGAVHPEPAPPQFRSIAGTFNRPKRPSLWVQAQPEAEAQPGCRLL